MIEHLSYSSINTFLSCAANWKMKYIDKLPTSGSPEMTLGTAIHDTIEQHLLGKGDLLSIYPEAWAKALTKDVNVFWGTDTPEQVCNEGIRLLSAKAVTTGIQQLKSSQTPTIETKVELHVPGVPIPIVGYIDLIDSHGVPGDFKTSKASWSMDKAAGSIQTLFYLTALNQAGDHRHNWVFRHYIIVKTKTPNFQVLEHSHRPGEMFWLLQMIKNVWMAIESGIYPENPTTWLCGPEYCDFYKQCRGKYG
jgi:hypothetical protein